MHEWPFFILTSDYAGTISLPFFSQKKKHPEEANKISKQLLSFVLLIVFFITLVLFWLKITAELFVLESGGSTIAT